MNAISELYAEMDRMQGYDADYYVKQIHPIPDAPSVDRVKYILDRCREKTVLHIGSAGLLHGMIDKVAADLYGIDIADLDIPNYFRVDLERITNLPYISGLDVIIAGEIIEHLSNAGRFLDLLHRAGVRVILTTPNAFSRNARRNLENGVENVNAEHVAWYSWHTLKVLVERHGFEIKHWAWYNGPPLYAEGLIFNMVVANG